MKWEMLGFPLYYRNSYISRGYKLGNKLGSRSLKLCAGCRLLCIGWINKVLLYSTETVFKILYKP